MVHRLETQIPFGNDNQRCNIGRTLWLAASCASMCMAAASAQQPGPRFALRPEQIELAMERAQMPMRGVQVKLAAPVTSSSANAKLEIRSVAMVSPRELRLRIGCSELTECLPFFAVATYPEAIGRAALPVKLDEKSAGSEQPAHDLKKASASSGSAALMRSGSPATLDLDSNKVHVRIEVVCLENGAAGEKVRVATRDRKLTYVAEVVTSTLLKGTF